MNPELLAILAAQAEKADQSTEWPALSLETVQTAGALHWSLPGPFGGCGQSASELLAAHERIATACLTTAFILSQREAAIRHLTKAPAHLQQRFLPQLVAGGYASVGLSQLTTSRQHRGHALRATATATGYRLDGEIPWVTGADQAVVIIIGATLEDSSQILVALPPDQAGLRIDPPMPLSALAGSRTAMMKCNGVSVEHELLLIQPKDRVLGPVGGGGLETTNLALGLAVAALDLIQQEATVRPDLAAVVDQLESATVDLRARVHALAVTPDSDAIHAARVDGTRLALQATQTALLAAKGAGFVHPHAAGRLARQALFFLVWSCPRPVVAGLLEDTTVRE